MSIIVCKNCGRKTNTTTCDHYSYALEHNYELGTEKCFAAIDENGNWVKGCAYSEADPSEKQFADRVISGDI